MTIVFDKFRESDGVLLLPVSVVSQFVCQSAVVLERFRDFE